MRNKLNPINLHSRNIYHFLPKYRDRNKFHSSSWSLSKVSYILSFSLFIRRYHQFSRSLHLSLQLHSFSINFSVMLCLFIFLNQIDIFYNLVVFILYETFLKKIKNSKEKQLCIYVDL